MFMLFVVHSKGAVTSMIRLRVLCECCVQHTRLAATCYEESKTNQRVIFLLYASRRLNCSHFVHVTRPWPFLHGTGTLGARRRKWRLADLCPCGETQVMSHIVESCPLTKLNGSLSRLHSADEDVVSWLTNCGSRHAYEKKKNASWLAAD